MSVLDTVGQAALAGPQIPGDVEAVSVWLSGAHVGASVAFEAALLADGPWYPVQSRRGSDGLVANESPVLGSGQSQVWTIPTLGAAYLRVRLLTLTSGGVSVEYVMPAPTVGFTPAITVTQHTTVTPLIGGTNGPLSTEVGTSNLYVPFDARVLAVTVALAEAPTVTAAIFDVNCNGTTIFTTQANRPQVQPGELTAISGPPDSADLTAGDLLTFDIDQIGSGQPGDTLVLSVWLESQP